MAENRIIGREVKVCNRDNGEYTAEVLAIKTAGNQGDVWPVLVLLKEDQTMSSETLTHCTLLPIQKL